MMEESHLPRKFLNNWHPNPRPVGRPLTTIRLTYLHALQYIVEIPDNDDQDRMCIPPPPPLEKESFMPETK
eukprot:2493339-Ditylum_brightwellii.AAC.1